MPRFHLAVAVLGFLAAAAPEARREAQYEAGETTEAKLRDAKLTRVDLEIELARAKAK